MKRTRCVLYLLLLLFIFFMVNCGGGGSQAPAPSSSPTPPPANSNVVPSITAVAPPSAITGSSDTTLTITGSGFVSTSTVQWNGSSIPTTYNSPTTLTATISAGMLAQAGSGKLTVVNSAPGGGSSSSIDFAVNNPAPAIVRITPASLVAGAGDTVLDISGSGFLSSTVVDWNGVALTTTFVSATELKATLPAADTTGSSHGSITAKNPAPGGGSSVATIFDVNSPIPAISSITPTQVVMGAHGTTVSITGTGFEANSVVQWNGAARPTTLVSSTELQVALSALDFQDQAVGLLTVSNPAPSASTSGGVQLIVTGPPPVIQSVSITSVPNPVGGCPQLQVAITGQNFTSTSTIQANGLSLPTVYYSAAPTTITNYLPQGFVSKPGTLSFTVTNAFGPVVSDPFPYAATNAPVLALCANPSPTTVFAGSSFSFTVNPTEVNVAGNETVSLGSLPTGITATSSDMALSAAGAIFHLQAASTTATGTYDLPLTATAGTSTAQGDFNFTVSTGAPPNFSFLAPLRQEVGVPIGGSGSIQYSTIVNSATSVDFDVTPSVTGLPPGTTASFSPPVFFAGQSVTVTLTAANNAPVTQNASVTLIGTPSVAVPNATSSFFADVTQPPGSLPGNRTDFVPLAGTPFAAAYDSAHNLIFASNPDWNRVDVISNVTHKIVKRIPVRSPRGLDITQDNTHVWVQTASPNVYAIDTSTLQSLHYTLPSNSITSSGLPVMFTHDRLLALSDGTLFMYFNDSGNGTVQAAVWNPQTSAVNVLSNSPSGWGFPVRNADGTHVYATSGISGNVVQVYNVNSKTTSSLGTLTGNYYEVAAVNGDGSDFVLVNTFGWVLYDQNFTLIGSLPGTPSSSVSSLQGGVLFSSDNKKLYEIGQYNNLGDILTIDASNLNVLGTAPAAVVNPVGVSGGSSAPAPFAIDSSGMILGLQNYGISFDDSTFHQNYAANQPGSNSAYNPIGTYAGPLAGGTDVSIYSFPNLTPDAWFGQTRGSADLSSNGGELTITSPPSTVPGPVNIKFIYPDGEQGFYPQLFSYSAFPEYVLTSGSSPDGGAPGQLLGYGLPQDPSGGTLTIGSNTATITTTAGQYPPLSGEPYPSTILKYTFPPGTPGWADLQVTTPIGTGSLPKSVFYATSVEDYASADTFTAVLFDAKRKQVYLSAGDHVDVFSTASNQFTGQLHPAALGSQKLFTGMALTPDGSQLLVADLPDGSLAVINPDSPSSTYAISVTTVHTGVNNCAIGPLYVAATSTNQAFVATGSLPAPSCPPFGTVYLANLQAHTATQSPICPGAVSVDASSDGSLIAIGSSPACLYSLTNYSYVTGKFPSAAGNSYGIAISGDGSVVGSDQILADPSLNMLGSVAHPIALYGNSFNNTTPSTLLLYPRLNASGSLYYFGFSNYFEVVDVAHATLRMRFSLTETLQNTAVPLAIDSGGRHVYLITDKGLTVVDLGAAPLSIGHLSQQDASPGTQVVVRGSGFDSGTTATVGGVAASVVVNDENTLALTIPAAPSGPQDIILTRSDGQRYTFENGIVLP